MKRFIINITRITLFTFSFLAALWLFIPWRSAGNFALSMAYSRLGRMGMRLNYSDVAGGDGSFTVNNLAVSGMANISLSSLTVKPDIAASILSIAPVCEITFKGASVRLGQTMNFGGGSFLLTAGSEILLENLRTDGDFSLNGYIAVNTSSMRISRANARLDVPETFSQNMGLLRNFLPLVQEGDRWYLRRN